MKRIEVFVESLVEFNYIQVDLRGYYGGSTTRKNFMGEPMREVIVERLAGEMALALAYSMIADESAAADVKAQKREKFEAWAKNPCSETFKPIRPGEIRFGGPECHVTGLRLQWEYDGQTIRPARYWDGERREYAILPRFRGVNGHLPAASYTIDIPSGKIAFFQWINDETLVKDQPHEERESVNSEAGRIAYSKYFEKLGFWHIYVGGRGRRLYPKGKNFRIGHKPEDGLTKHEAAIWRGWKEVGVISFRTDLKWFTACDASRLKPKHFEEDEVLEVKVPAGRYTLMDHVEHGKEETVYATITSKVTTYYSGCAENNRPETAMTAAEVYQTLLQLTDSNVKSYRDDLLIHDKQSIEENPEIPFLHWTRSTGTTLVFLPPHDSPAFPPKGQTVPYLFGRVNRVELSQKPLETAQFFANQQGILTHHFDGQKIRRITEGQAEEVARNYARSVQSRW